MATQFAEVITNYAMPIIDDTRLSSEIVENPALFFRRMSVFVNVAIPMLDRPPALTRYLEDGLTPAEYSDFYWTSDGTRTVVETGQIGYDLMSCQINQTAKDGTVFSEAYTSVEYDSETGNVTFPESVGAGIELQMDFYKDGSFAQDLTVRIKRLIGLAIAILWDERFTRNWLNMQQKIHDKSFDTVNEGTYTRETQNRLDKNRSDFYSQLRKYEQDCAYSRTVPTYAKRTEFV